MYLHLVTLWSLELTVCPKSPLFSLLLLLHALCTLIFHFLYFNLFSSHKISLSASHVLESANYDSHLFEVLFLEYLLYCNCRAMYSSKLPGVNYLCIAGQEQMRSLWHCLASTHRWVTSFCTCAYVSIPHIHIFYPLLLLHFPFLLPYAWSIDGFTKVCFHLVYALITFTAEGICFLSFCCLNAEIVHWFV